MHQVARQRLEPQVIFASPDAGLGVRLASCLNDATGNGCWPNEAGRRSSLSFNTVNEPETKLMT